MVYNAPFTERHPMKTTRISLCLLLVAAMALPVGAQPGTIDHRPAACVPGEEMAVLTAATEDQGLFRVYFRHTGTTDWCSVDGKNNGAASNVVLPKFATGDEIEYYFVVLDGKRIVAKSPEIYRIKATPRCDSPVARHVILLSMECMPPGLNPIASALNAGYAAASTYTGNPPPVRSPEKPRFLFGGQ
jgi:hypothetical protein